MKEPWAARGLFIRVIRNVRWYWGVARLSDGSRSIDLGPVSVMWIVK